ncbi:MAG: hypothetical protein ACXWC9_01305 [Pseudobdellovibrionaceae bacterium]
MFSLKPIFADTFANIKKHFGSLALVALMSTVSAQLPLYFFEQQPFLMVLSILPQILIQAWCMIAVYQIISDQPFNFLTQVQSLIQKFPRWALGMIAGYFISMRSLFPWILPAFYRLLQIFLIGPVLLFENDARVNAITKSKAIIQSKEWKLFGIYFSISIFTLLVNQILKKLMTPDMAQFFLILFGTITTLLSSVFLITFYRTRSQVAVVEPETEPVNYGKLIGKNIGGAIGGFLWTIFVITLTSFVLVAVVKFLQKAQGT